MPNLSMIKPACALLALLSIALLLACAPAAAPAQGGETEPTAEATPKPDDVKPTPTRDPGDPARPTPLPTATFRPPEKPTPTPKGQTQEIMYTFDFCAEVSLLDPSPGIRGNLSDVIPQCSDIIGKAIQEQCVTGTTVAETMDEETQACIKRLLDRVKDYQLRRLKGYDCIGIGLRTDDDMLQCFNAEGERHQRLQSMLRTTTLEILAIVDVSSGVNQAEKRAWICLEASGEKNLAAQDVNLNRLLFWEEMITEEQHRALGELPQLRLEKIQERAMIVDRCAIEAGVYEARLRATLEELHRLVAEEPDKAEPWVEFGRLAALEEFGTAMLRP